MPIHWRAPFTLAHPPRQLHLIGRSLFVFTCIEHTGHWISSSAGSPTPCRAQRATHACFARTQPLAGNRRATLRAPAAPNSTLFVSLSLSFSLALSLLLSSSFSPSLYDNDSHCRRRDGGGDGNRPCETRPCVCTTATWGGVVPPAGNLPRVLDAPLPAVAPPVNGPIADRRAPHPTGPTVCGTL